MLPSTNSTTQSALLKWVNFSLGSVLIHLSGFWVLQNAPLRPVTVELRSDTIPVEYIDPLPPSAPSNPSPPAIPPQSSPSTPPASPRLNSPIAATTPQATPQAPSQVTPQPSPVASPRVNPSPRTVFSPPPSPSPVVRSTPATSPSPPPPPRVSPPPSPSPVVRSTPATSPSPPPPPRVSPPPSPSPVVRSTPAASPSPPPTLSPSPAAPSQGVSATILGVQSGNGGRDEPTQLAQSQIQQKSFPALVNPLGNQPTVLQVRLLIDQQGRPEVQSILQGTDSPEIRRFVENLMQDWQFSPALSGGAPVYSFLDVSVRITPSGS